MAFFFLSSPLLVFVFFDLKILEFYSCVYKGVLSCYFCVHSITVKQVFFVWSRNAGTVYADFNWCSKITHENILLDF